MLRPPPVACETPGVSAVLDVSRPTPLRLFGFLFTAIGGLLIALGAIGEWATVGIVGDEAGVLDTAIPGIDRAEGKAVLAAGIAILVGIVSLRVVDSHSARRAVASVIVACAAASLVVGVLDLVDTRDRFDDAGADRIIETISTDQDLPIEEVRRNFGEIDAGLIRVDPGLGLWLVIAGGALGLIGGLLDLAWVGQQRLAAVGADVEPA